MIIQYSPDGGEMQRFDAGRLRASEIQVIERTADGRWTDIKDDASRGDINAMRVIAWAIKKRTEPTLRFAAFDPFEDELRVLFDAREVRAYAENFVDRYASEPEQLAKTFGELRDAAADREACEQIITDVTVPKDPAPAAAGAGPLSACQRGRA
ncbi:hypothetical protein ACJ6WF_36130 [Streptomyces sp. MMS24-I2-30]|uniref:hypothetical protein n=1 Tax=Streptomyces sp. MMS24-I2-30 TaxID=3351564 RepID=UPI003896E5F3